MIRSHASLVLALAFCALSVRDGPNVQLVGESRGPGDPMASVGRGEAQVAGAAPFVERADPVPAAISLLNVSEKPLANAVFLRGDDRAVRVLALPRAVSSALGTTPQLLSRESRDAIQADRIELPRVIERFVLLKVAIRAQQLESLGMLQHFPLGDPAGTTRIHSLFAVVPMVELQGSERPPVAASVALSAPSLLQGPKTLLQRAHVKYSPFVMT